MDARLARQSTVARSCRPNRLFKKGMLGGRRSRHRGTRRRGVRRSSGWLNSDRCRYGAPCPSSRSQADGLEDRMPALRQMWNKLSAATAQALVETRSQRAAAVASGVGLLVRRRANSTPSEVSGLRADCSLFSGRLKESLTQDDSCARGYVSLINRRHSKHVRR